MVASDFRTDSDASLKMQIVSSSEASEPGDGSRWEILVTHGDVVVLTSSVERRKQNDGSRTTSKTSPKNTILTNITGKLNGDEIFFDVRS